MAMYTVPYGTDGPIREQLGVGLGVAQTKKEALLIAPV